MPKTLTATDRSALIRLASTLPVGSDERKAILAGLSKSALGGSKSLWMSLLKQLRFPGWVLADENSWNTPPINRSGLDAVWEKKFEVGQQEWSNKPVFATYGVTLTVRLSETDQGFDADALMSWHGPGVFGSRKRFMYSQKFSDAFEGEGRRWQVSPEMVRWVNTNFKKVVKGIQPMVQEDIEIQADPNR